jgi:chaperonin GroES
MIKPISNNILIEPIKEGKYKDTVTESGFIIPETAEKESLEQGRVIAVGPGKKNSDGKIIPPDIKIGSTVFFRKFDPEKIMLENKEYLIAKEEDIFAILE